ncbi:MULTISPECIES: hypothetical protein [Nostoc]|uniref:Uncharacterized protein n=1 Tax=Nostoc paludosum FACHB-159 TaxID=2692908 RepID=A0ABR8K347_9NOSO|nr:MULTISPECIES: hypothetical protein [Nostoc]MBD2676199.1 hypothetical protein [Nostoc sp. FACHB-857]MBD2732672.1 hypothetical protein [Nostoc paludosum FACHB-159]
MSTIKIHDLNPAGSELFQDSESFLHELTNAELEVQGGFRTQSFTYCWPVSWTIPL